MSLIKNSVITEVDATVNGKYVASLAAAVPDESEDVLADTDKYDAAGYVLPFMGGVPKLRKWITGSRQVKSLNEYGMRLTGSVWESTVGISVTDLADGITTNLARLGAAFATEKMARKPEALAELLNENAVSLFDNAPLFGDHTFTNPDNALDVTTYNNSIETGTGAFWYVVHSSPSAKPMFYALRTGEEGSIQIPGGTPQGSEHTFFNDEAVIGLRMRDLAGTGLWFYIVRSNKAFTADNLQEAIDRLASFRNDRGQQMPNKATHAVVPSTMVPAAEKVLKAVLVNGGDTNTYAGKLGLATNEFLATTAPAPVGP